MKITKKRIFVIIIILVLVFSLSKYIRAKQIFSSYLKNNYPESSFKIGIIKYDPIYPKIYAEVKSDDGIEFIIKRPPRSNKIFEHYLRKKYEREVNIVIENYLGQELLKNIEYIRCAIDTKMISDHNYSMEDLLNNIDYLSISYKSNSMNNFNQFFHIANGVFEKLNKKNIQANKQMRIYTYTSDHLECNLVKEKEAYTLHVKVLAEDITTNEEYQQKRQEIQQIADENKIKIARVNISYKGDLK